MQYCYDHSYHRQLEGITIGLAGLFLFIILEGIYNLFQFVSIIHSVIYSGVIIFGVVFFSIASMEYLAISRKYRITEFGIIIQYPLGITVKYSWDILSEVGVCKVHYTTRGSFSYLTVIRCVVGEEKNGPSKGYGRWADSLYSTIHFNKVVVILYTEERHKEFNSICPLDVIDYRGIKRYPFDPE